MSKYSFVPIEEMISLLANGKHQSACFDGDVYGQIYTPDMRPTQVYLARVCKICGVPFADGSNVIEARKDLDTYVAEESEALQPSLNHLHATNTKTGQRELFYIQPNRFLSMYNPSGTIIETDVWGEEEFLIKNMGNVIPLPPPPEIGRRRHTEGGILLEIIYERYYPSEYPSEKPIPPKIPQLIREVKGNDYYKRIAEAMIDTNRLPKPTFHDKITHKFVNPIFRRLRKYPII